MKKKRKLKKKVVILLILIPIIIIASIGIVLYKSFDKKETNHQEVVDKIGEYDYTLENDHPKAYKELFKELTKELNKEKPDEKKYAELVAQMFAVDFYNLDNKVSKNDIGGVQFIASNYKNNFAFKASDTVYKYVEQNLYGERKQTLPEVKSSSVKEIKNDKYKYKNINDDNVYIVTVNLEYKKDLDYPEEVIVKLLHNDKKLEVYEMK